MQQTTEQTTPARPTNKVVQKITPFLWFDSQAEEAANYYVSIFKNSRVGGITRYDKNVAEVAGRPAGSVMTVEFELEGQKFVALNGGPMFKFSEAVSFMVSCESQAQIDELNSKLLADGGEQQPCGWLKDKFGLSWQIVPAVVGEMIHDADPAKVSRFMAAIMEMRKLDLAALERAFEGNG